MTSTLHASHEAQHDEQAVRVDGDFHLSANAALPTGVMCAGDARLGAGARVDGDLDSATTIEVGPGARVTGRVRGSGGVTWHPRASAGGLDSEGPFRVGAHKLAGGLKARRGVTWSEEGA